MSFAIEIWSDQVKKRMAAVGHTAALDQEAAKALHETGFSPNDAAEQLAKAINNLERNDDPYIIGHR